MPLKKRIGADGKPVFTSDTSVAADALARLAALGKPRLEEIEASNKAGNKPPTLEEATPLGDRVSNAPQLAEDPTGISGPGAEGVQTTQELGQGVVTSEEERAQAELEAQQEDQVRANQLAENVRGDIDETTGLIDAAGNRLQESEQRFQENMEGAAEQIRTIPTEVTNEFNRLRDEFGDQADVSFDRIDSQRTEALGNAEQGRSAAMQAAVQGIQGNVNNQVAQIMSNPNLTDAQKQGMVSQVRLAGASSMAPAIGATVLQFNQLSASIATKFGAITGQLEGIVLQGSAQLIGLQGQAFTQAQIAVGQMTNQLLEIDANASVGFANSQSQLLATRSHATMTGNDILLRTLPEQSTPYIDLTGAATISYEIGRNLMMSQWEVDAQSFGMDLQIAMLRSMQGSPVSNMIDSFLSGFQSGGLVGGIFGAIGSSFGEPGLGERI